MTKLETLMEHAAPEDLKRMLTTLMSFSFEEEDGTLNFEKEISGADLVDQFCQAANQMVAKAQETQEEARKLEETLEQDRLDDLVYEGTEDLACRINNSGPRGQCIWLAKEGLKKEHVAAEARIPTA
jgi:hypothetical protein